MTTKVKLALRRELDVFGGDAGGKAVRWRLEVERPEDAL
jgi:hypothetical protein